MGVAKRVVRESTRQGSGQHADESEKTVVEWWNRPDPWLPLSETGGWQHIVRDIVSLCNLFWEYGSFACKLKLGAGFKSHLPAPYIIINYFILIISIVICITTTASLV